MLQPVPLFGLGNQGKSVSVDAQQRVNLYAEIDIESGTLKLYPTPGKTSFVNFGANPARGVYTKGDFMYEVNGSTLWQIANDGTTTSRGTLLTSSGRVDITDNGDQMLIVDGTYGYIYTFATVTLAQIVDVDYPASSTCAFLNGYFLVQKTDSARWYKSALYDGMTWDALDFATAESDPDNLVRIMADNGMVLLFGEKTTEFWGDSGAADFPFARIGSAAIEWGLAARWSLCKFMDSLIFLRKNRLGAVQVCVLAGTTAIPVSNAEVDFDLSTYTSMENATGFAYMVSGHPFFQLNIPSANVSWLYDGGDKGWSKVGTNGRDRGEIQTNYLNRSYVSDFENGKLYLVDQDAYTEDGATIAREFVGKHLVGGDYIKLAALWLEMEVGVGLQSGQGDDPQVMLQVSRDGGQTWGPEVWRSFGAVGQYMARALWNRIGRARGGRYVFKFRITDPVKVVITAAWGRLGR